MSKPVLGSPNVDKHVTDAIKTIESAITEKNLRGSTQAIVTRGLKAVQKALVEFQKADKALALKAQGGKLGQANKLILALRKELKELKSQTHETQVASKSKEAKDSKPTKKLEIKPATEQTAQ